MAESRRAATNVTDEDATGGVPDAALVARAKADPAAFAALYDRYADRVYRYCYRRLGSREAAEDATSLVFTRALAALPTCRDPSFRSWLFAIAHNAVANAHRDARPDLPLAAADDLTDPTDASPEAQILAADDVRRLRALLAELPPDQRDVVELRLSGLGGPEIARALGRSYGAVKALQFRAVARLRRRLGVATRNEEAGHDPN